jgi:hypothetical protein
MSSSGRAIRNQLILVRHFHRRCSAQVLEIFYVTDPLILELGSGIMALTIKHVVIAPEQVRVFEAVSIHITGLKKGAFYHV